MSRPQFPVNTQAAVTPGHIVNGGLIDFQDNFHRGMAESYASYMHAQQQLSSPCSNPFPVQQYQAGMQSLQGPGGGQFACISGPPAYFHVNGQTYVPVDAQQPVTVAGAPKVQVEAPTTEAARVYTEEDVERRARDKVEEWAASKLKSYRAEPEARKPLKTRAPTELDRAAERINSVNAGMRGRFNSPF